MDASSLPPSVDDDSVLAGSIVAERLQTLKVACEGSWDAKAAGPLEDGEQAPLSPELLREGPSANSSEPPLVALIAGDAPHCSAAAEGKPAAVGDSNGRSSPGTDREQACPPVEHPQAVEAPPDKEEERQPSEGAKVVDHHQPSSSSAFQGGKREEDGDLDGQTAALSKKPTAQGSEKKGPLSGENEARSESDR